MNHNLHSLLKRFAQGVFTFVLGLSIVFIPFSNPLLAARTSMSGDYVNDTLSVVHSLQETINLSRDAEGRSDAESEAVSLITDYISRYRNRPQVNGTLSFTTMQTALNAMAGHYKTFANRPLPDQLKERLTSELATAEKLVTRDS